MLIGRSISSLSKFVNFLWNLSYKKKFQNFSIDLEFMELKYHEKLKFPISCRSLSISETVINCKIFSKIILFGHFRHFKIDKINFGELK